ncbi:hypothetical protein [Ruegeria sp.]|uniref:hypothetical protein n=1 Tax=Ruegeria sp. TaxID=1879320 RepID=UPI003B00C6CE
MLPTPDNSECSRHLKMQQSIFAITNNSELSTVITLIQCGLFLPTDPRAHLDEVVLKGKPLEKYRWRDIAGMFMVSFTPDEPIQIEPGGQAVVTFHVKHVSPAFGADRFRTPREPEELVSSYCLISGVRGNNELTGGIMLLTPQDTSNLDALKLLQIADYSEQQEPERMTLKSKLLSARSVAE